MFNNLHFDLLYEKSSLVLLFKMWYESHLFSVRFEIKFSNCYANQDDYN